MIIKEDMSFRTITKGAELLANLKEVSSSLDFKLSNSLKTPPPGP